MTELEARYYMALEAILEISKSGKGSIYNIKLISKKALETES